MKINRNINHKRLWLVSMTGMSMGFFSTLIIGSFIGILGLYSNDNIFTETKRIMSVITSFAIGIGIGVSAKGSPIQILAIAIATSLVANSLVRTEFTGGKIVADNVKIGIDTAFRSSGDVLAAWIAGVFMLYVFEIFQWESNFDFLIVPFIGILLGILNALWMTYLVSLVTVCAEWVIYHTANKTTSLAIVLAPVIGIIMGFALSLPTSSAAMAIALKLHGDAALAALAGTAAQMVSFGVLTYWATRSVSKTIAVGLGTSMLHMANYSKKPILLVIPMVVSGLTSLISVAAFHGTLPFVPGSPTSGMGTAVLYGQIFTMNENGWANSNAWLNVLLIQIALPILLTLPLLFYAGRKNIIRKEWLELWNSTQPNTLAKPVR